MSTVYMYKDIKVDGRSIFVCGVCVCSHTLQFLMELDGL